DVAMGKDLGICDEEFKVDVSEFVDVVDIEVVGIDREVGIIGTFRDVSDVEIGVFDVDVDKGLDVIGWVMIDVDEIVGMVKFYVDVVKVGIDVDAEQVVEVN
ncbi:hypothetical protein KI387_010303, partial [Taxus chinensis]